MQVELSTIENSHLWESATPTQYALIHQYTLQNYQSSQKNMQRLKVNP